MVGSCERYALPLVSYVIDRFAGLPYRIVLK